MVTVEPKCTRVEAWEGGVNRAVARRACGGMFALQTRDFSLDLREPLRRYQIGMRRNRTFRQLLDRVLAVWFFDECSAHGDANKSFRSVASADTAYRATLRQNQMRRTGAAVRWNLSARKKVLFN